MLCFVLCCAWSRRGSFQFRCTSVLCNDSEDLSYLYKVQFHQRRGASCLLQDDKNCCLLSCKKQITPWTGLQSITGFKEHPIQIIMACMQRCMLALEGLCELSYFIFKVKFRRLCSESELIMC